MPNLRDKTWTTTTPATVTDAQYWEDHLISDEDAAKAASSVQTVNNTAPDANGNINITPHFGGPTVIDSLNSTSATDALSANQGHVLKGKTDDIWSVIGENGAKNLNRTTYNIPSNSRGITFVINSDGTISATGTNDNTGNSNIGAGAADVFTSNYSGDVLVSGGVSEKCVVYLHDRTANARATNDITSPTQEETATLVLGHDYQLVCSVKKGAPKIPVATPVTFKPMIRFASDTDSTYQPSCETNQQLTANKVSYANNGILGAKNRLIYPYKYTTITLNGIPLPI